MLPELAGVMIFGLIPFADVVRRSFFRMADHRFAGLANYAQVLTNDAFRLAVKNTFRFAAVCLPLLLLLSLIAALLLRQAGSLSVLLKSIYLLPMAIPAAGVVVLWKLLFDRHGFFNGALAALCRTDAAATDWMNTGVAFAILMFSYIWKYIGYDVILWLAGLSAIPESIYEAAQMDGAGNVQTFFYITFPNLRPAAFTIVVLSVLNSFKVFREVYMAAGSYPQESIYLLQHVFNNWFLSLSVDKMAAASVMLAFVIAVFVLLLQKSWED